MTFDPISGEFDVDVKKMSTGGWKNGSPTITMTFEQVDYTERFLRKQEALFEIYKEEGDVNQDEVEDFLLTAQKAIWQESRDG